MDESRGFREGALIRGIGRRSLPRAVFGADLGARVSLRETLKELEQHPNPDAIAKALEKAKQRLNAPIANEPAVAGVGRPSQSFSSIRSIGRG